MSEPELEKTIASTVHRIWFSPDRDRLTVNYVRQQVEKQQALDEGFLSTGAWKEKSKNIIRETSDGLVASEDRADHEAESKAESRTDSKTAVKRQSSDEPSPASKRAKTAAHEKGTLVAGKDEARTKSVSHAGAKRPSSDESSSVPKRTKKTARSASSKTKPIAKKLELDSELSDLEDLKNTVKKESSKKTAPARDRTDANKEQPASARHGLDGAKKQRAEKELVETTSPKTAGSGAKQQQSDSELSDSTRSEREALKKTVPNKDSEGQDTESGLTELQDSEDAKPEELVGKRAVKEESSSDLSDVATSFEDRNPTGKDLSTAAPCRNVEKSKKANGSDEEGGDQSNVKSKSGSSRRREQRDPPGNKRHAKHANTESDSEDGPAPRASGDDSEASKYDVKASYRPTAKREMKKQKKLGKGGDHMAKAVEDAKPVTVDRKEDGTKPKEDDSSDLSSVIEDEPLPKKRKSQGTKTSGTAKATKAAKELTGEEAEIKTLQSQLTKCGVRKIWTFELRNCGDDNRAKIRHLKNMLSEIGMVGRFSSARAKQIKERREMLDDLQAVQTMNSMWGADGGGGRASRSKAKTAKNVPVSESEEERAEKKARERKRNADLAFLGSESESE